MGIAKRKKGTGNRMKGGALLQLKKTISRLRAIVDLYRRVGVSPDLDMCVKRLLEKVDELFAAEVISIMLLDKERGELAIKIAKGIKEDIVKVARAKLGEGIAGKVAKEAVPILIKDFGKHPHLKGKGGKRYKTNSCISVPIMVEGEMLGVINVTDKIGRASFTRKDLNALASIAHDAAVVLKNSQVFDELKRINAVKSDFLAMLSHEIKSPLTNVKASINILMEEMAKWPAKEHVRFLNIANDNVERLIRLINNLLDISKLESGRVTMRRRLLDMRGLIKDVGTSFVAAFDRKKIKFSLAVPASDISIWGDHDRIGEVVTNLLSNSVKFTPVGGKIRLELSDAGQNVRFAVSDNGIGITKKDMPRIFDKFFTVSFKKGVVEPGTGLGLSIAKDIVSMHRGNIWVESEVGKGSTFIVELPKDLRQRDREEAPAKA